jgi:signal transduction histidine kinase
VEALRTSDTRFRELFNRMSSGVAVYEAIDDGGDFLIRDVNPAAERIEEVTRDGILGKRVSEVFPGVRAFGLFAVFQRVWQTGKPEYFPGNIYRDERRLEGWRENWVFKLPTGEVVAIYNEITERKQAEAALRALARHLNSVREEEHTRIARQVHDELGQALTALRLDLTWVGRKLPNGHTALRRRMDAAVALTDEMIAVGHDIVGELRPPILDDLGLVPALEWHAQQVAKRSGVRIQVEGAAGERVVADDLAVSAYRIVQEALANVVRHAHAKHVRVRLGEQDGGLTIEIRDDGQGFPEQAASDPRSFGITGMRERAASHGGALVITGSPGAGTTVRVTFPPERRKEPRAPR